MIPAKAAAVRFVVDTRASQFTVQAFASGLISVVAHSPKIAIRDWTAEAQMASANFADVFLRVRVQAASLEVLDELPDSDRRELHRIMNQDVLETAKFPEVEFESLAVQAEKAKEDVYKLRVLGKLNLHGVTNEHSFDAQVSTAGDRVRAYGEFMVRQSDYGIRIASIAGGSLKLSQAILTKERRK